MGRRFRIKGRRVAAVADRAEEQARAKYLDARLIRGSELAISDLGLYPVKGSAELRAAADKALEVELEASVANGDDEIPECLK